VIREIMATQEAGVRVGVGILVFDGVRVGTFVLVGTGVLVGLGVGLGTVNEALVPAKVASRKI
jgi:hypothetical protein